MTFLKRAVLAVAVSLLAAVAAFGTAGSAQAATPAFKLCNYGSGYLAFASFPDRRMSTVGVWPNQCVEMVGVGANERFAISARPIVGNALTPSRVDWTFAGGRTLVQTWGTFNAFSYGKLPY
ncbi:hypothetical protein ACQPYE_17405 [Actinosynnema sp. CA-299493]